MYTEIKLVREVEKEREGEKERKREEGNKCLGLSKLNKLLQEVCKRES